MQGMPICTCALGDNTWNPHMYLYTSHQCRVCLYVPVRWAIIHGIAICIYIHDINAGFAYSYLYTGRLYKAFLWPSCRTSAQTASPEHRQ